MLKNLFLSFLVFSFSSFANYQKDLEIFNSQISKKHISPFDVVSNDELTNKIEQLKLKTKGLSKLSFTIELMKLTRLIGDGHTAVHLDDKKLMKFPITLFEENGNYLVTEIDSKYKDILGMKLTHIDGNPIEAVLSELSEIVQFVENPYSVKIRTLSYIKYSEILFKLGLIKNSESSHFKFSNGKKEIEIELHAFHEFPEMTLFKTLTPKITPIFKSDETDFWIGTIENTQAVYIKFSEYPSFDEMNKFGSKLLSYINENDSSQIIIDLRGNWGGDFYVGLSLAYYLNLADSIDWLTGVYTLVDNKTFSAATTNATQYRQLLNSRIIGEPTGSNPSGFQDMGTFILPNSGLTISYSKRFFKLQESINTALYPDVFIPRMLNSMKQGEDNVLKWVIQNLSIKK